MTDHPVLDGPIYKAVDGDTPIKPVTGRCADLGHFYDRDGACLYCGEPER